jgi:hypothetical protein
MPISFSVRLRNTDGLWVAIREYRVRQQIVLAGEADSWPRAVVLGLNAADPITEMLLEQFFQQQGRRTFEFTAMLAGDRLRLVGQAPNGSYMLRVAIEGLTLQKETLPLTIREGYEDIVIATVVADPRGIRQVHPFDSEIEQVLQASTLEGETALDWVSDSTQRASRRACVQNILAKLRCAPSVADPLLPLIKDVFLAAPNRVYAAVHSRLHERLQELVAAGEWSHEGEPVSPCHARLLEQLTARGMEPDADQYALDSFRQETAPSVQIVVAVPPTPGRSYYADIDIDLGNPFMDLRGLVVHASEVASGNITDHLAMWRELSRDPLVAPFLAYEVVQQAT